MSDSGSLAAALVSVEPEWRPIFHDSNQVVLYNPTSHAISVKPRPPCPYCKQPLPLGFDPPFAQQHQHEPNVEHDTTRASNYFHLLAIANESGSAPPTRPPSPGTPVSESVVFEEEEHRGRTSFPAGTLAEGYFHAFFREECKLGMGANGSVYLCQHLLDGNSLGHFAVKKIAVGESHSYLLNILREVRLLERLHHPNIITYHHAWLESFQFSPFGPSVPTLHVLMQWADGGSLDDYIDVRLGREPRHGKFVPNPYESESINPLDPEPSTHLSNASLSSLSGSSSASLASSSSTQPISLTAKPIRNADPTTQAEDPEPDLHSRSARIRAFRAFQHASPEDKERIRKDMQFQESQSKDAGGPQTTWTPVHLLSAEEVHSLFRDVVEGLSFLHDRSILHLDLKPGNVLLTWDDGRGKMIPRAMLSDFGTSRDMLASTLNHRSGNTGTLEYAAPESLPSPQTGQLREIDSKADMWSLGMVLHRMLFFRLPWKYSADGVGVGEDPNTPIGTGLAHPLDDARPHNPKIRRPPARDEAEKMDRLEQEVLTYPGFRSTPALVQALELRKLPRAVLVLLETLLNPVPNKRPTCGRVKGAVRDGKLDPLPEGYRDYGTSLTRNVYNVRTPRPDETSGEVVNSAPISSSMNSSLVPISSISRRHSRPPLNRSSSSPTSQDTRSSSVARNNTDTRSESEEDTDTAEDKIVTLDLNDDSPEDFLYHDAHDSLKSSEELDRNSGNSHPHPRKALLALPAPIPDLSSAQDKAVQVNGSTLGPAPLVTKRRIMKRMVKSVILVIKIINLTTLCQCDSGDLALPGRGPGLAVTIVVILLAVVDTWFEDFSTTVAFGVAHVVVVKLGAFYLGNVCRC